MVSLVFSLVSGMEPRAFYMLEFCFSKLVGVILGEMLMKSI